MSAKSQQPKIRVLRCFNVAIHKTILIGCKEDHRKLNKNNADLRNYFTLRLSISFIIDI